MRREQRMVVWSLLLAACGARSAMDTSPPAFEGAPTTERTAASSGAPGTRSAPDTRSTGGTSTSAGTRSQSPAAAAATGTAMTGGAAPQPGGAFAVAGESAAGRAAGGAPDADPGGSGGNLSADERCGNGALEPGEACDDGGNVNRDGCSSVCTFESLTIALESKGHCSDSEQLVLIDLAELLRARHHAAYLVDASSLDTASELRNFDVVVLGGVRSNCASSSVTDNDLDAFDPLIPDFLLGGGGIVASGWVLWGPYLDHSPNIAAALPTVRSDDTMSGPLVTPVPGSAFISRFPFQPFEVNKYAACAGGSKPGADRIINVGMRDCGAIWQRGKGRAAFVGPLFTEPYLYENQSLLDGSQPGSIELIVRLVEWAGGFY